MGSAKKSWIDKLLLSRSAIFCLVTVLGLAAYFIVLLSFMPRSHGFKIVGNGALNDYATAVGGLVGTAVTITGVSFLLYAYTDQRRQAQSELFNKLYVDLLEDINSIQYRRKYKEIIVSAEDSQLFEGVDALYNYEADDDKHGNSVLNHLNLIIISFEHITNLLRDSKYQDDAFKSIMYDKVYSLFFAKIYWPCNNLYAFQRARLMNIGWGNAKILFYKFSTFTNTAYRHLYDRELIFLTSPRQSLEAILTMKDEDSPIEKTLLAILKSKSSSLEEYLQQNHTEPTVYRPALPPSCLNKLVLKVTRKQTGLSDAIIELLAQGLFIKARRFVYWTRTAHKQPSKYPPIIPPVA